MPESSVHLLESILRMCAAAAPEPWYPSTYAKETNTPRETLDPHLDQLRLAGLVHLTDWVAGYGQGYALTPAGEDVLKNPRQLARLVSGKWSPPVDRSEKRRTSTDSSPWQRGETVRAVFSHPKPSWVTYGIMMANVFVFLVGLFLAVRAGIRAESFLRGSTGEIMEATGGVTALDLLHGQWWRLVSSSFVHAGLLHIGANMLGLYFLGPLGEQMWGRGRYLLLYLIAGLGGNCVALMINPAILNQGRISIILLVGASGAICGLLASEAIWIILNRRHLPSWLVSSFLRNVVINVIIIAYIGSAIPNVSNAGHFGGGVVGALTAVLLNYQRFGSTRQRWVAIVGVMLVPVVCIGLLVRAMNTSAAWLPLREEVEENEINAYLPDMHSTEQKALTTYSKEVEPLLERRASRRNSQDVTRVIEHLEENLQELEDKVKVLQKRAPFSSPFIERARQVRLELTNAWIALLQLSKECLQKGEKWTEKDEERRKQQETELARIQKEWGDVVNNHRGP